VKPGWTDELTRFHEQHAGDDHWIDIASRRRASMMLARYGPATGRVLDVGCSSGFLLQELRRQFPTLKLYGADVLPGPLADIASSLREVPLVALDLTACPLTDNALDAIVLLNVLEHIEDDRSAIEQVFRILRPGGVAVIEVPAGPGLFDVYDEVLLHHRRYRSSAFCRALSETGFEIIDRSHLGFFLFPPFFVVKKVSRLLRRVRRANPTHTVSRRIRATRRNPLAERIMKTELAAGRWFRFPVGIRCVVTARKP
jgi:SAM-dependent methyltransferase